MQGAIRIPTNVRVFPLCVCVGLSLALCLGGGTRPGLLSDVIAQIAMIPLLLWASWKLLQGEAGRAPVFALVLLGLALLFPIAQLLPVQFPVGAGSVGRQLQDEVLALTGHSPSSAVTVASDVSLLSVVSLLPAVAIFLATLVMPQRNRRWLVYIVIGYAFLSVLLGLLQLSQGQDSALRFYAITNKEDAVGFFANRNHFSALLNCALVLTSAWMLFVASDAGMRAVTGPWRQVSLIAGFTLIVSLLAAQAMVRSRAGVGLALVALILSYAMMPGLVRPKDARANPMRALAVAIALGAILAIQYGTSRLIERFAIDPLQDARKLFARNTYEAILDFLPWGSGLGTFTQVYPSFERLETALVSTYVNRAHNDVIEYVLEGGFLAALVIGLAILYFGVRALPLWRSGEPVTLDLMLRRASACVLVLILLHSVLDYPLRTGAMLALLAVSAGLLVSHWVAVPDDLVHVDPRRSDRTGKTRRRPIADVSDAGPEATTVEPRVGKTAPPPRAAWGQDVAWPDAWKPDAKKGSAE